MANLVDCVTFYKGFLLKFRKCQFDPSCVSISSFIHLLICGMYMQKGPSFLNFNSQFILLVKHVFWLRIIQRAQEIFLSIFCVLNKFQDTLFCYVEAR